MEPGKVASRALPWCLLQVCTPTLARVKSLREVAMGQQLIVGEKTFCFIISTFERRKEERFDFRTLEKLSKGPWKSGPSFLPTPRKKL